MTIEMISFIRFTSDPLELLGLLIVVHIHFNFSRHSLSLGNRQQLVRMKTKQHKSYEN